MNYGSIKGLSSALLIIDKFHIFQKHYQGKIQESILYQKVKHELIEYLNHLRAENEIESFELQTNSESVIHRSVYLMSIKVAHCDVFILRLDLNTTDCVKYAKEFIINWTEYNLSPISELDL